MTAASQDDLSAALPAYDIGAELGRGGYGVVRAGRHRRLGRQVAIKQIPPALASDPGVRARFIEEARALASLDHPHIVQIYDYIERDELCLLVMEYLPRGSVADVTVGTGVTGETACAIGLVTCAGLHYAHQHNILHRDIKPENALYSAKGVLKVTDFGIAKVVGGGDVYATSAGELLGTPAYMAPEQATGEGLGPAADVYATGIMLYELLSGRLPFSEAGGGLAIVYRHVYERPVHLLDIAPAVPRGLAEVVMRALEREVPDRFSSAEDFGVALARAATSSLGGGWLNRSAVELLAPGPILEAAVAGGRANSGGQTTAPVRRLTTVPKAGRARASALDAADLVPVRAALPADARAGRAGRLALALGAATAVAALALPSLSGTTGTQLPQGATVTVNGADVADGGRIDVDFSEPVDVAVAPAPTESTTARLHVTAGGVQLGQDPTARLQQDGTAKLPARSLAWIAGGRATARLQLENADGLPVAPAQTFVARPAWSSRFLAAALTLGLVLFLGAYGEALLRPLRRRRRLTVPALLGMSVIGAGAGVATVLVVWVLGLQLLTLPTLISCGLLGGAAAVAGTVAVTGGGAPTPGRALVPPSGRRAAGGARR